MTVSINPVEAVWLAITLSTLGFTFVALYDTWKARGVVLKLNGRAREIVAVGNVRREVIRLFVTLCLTAIAVPLALRENEIEFTWSVAFLMLIPGLLLINSVLDTYDRKRVLRIVTDEIVSERRASMLKIQAVVDDTHERVVDIQANTVPNGDEPREQREPRELREPRETPKTITQPREPREPRPDRPPRIDP